jgi:hypothetical protein
MMSLENCGVFQLLKEVTLCLLCHSSIAFVWGSFVRHPLAFSGSQSIGLSMILKALEYISLSINGFSLTDNEIIWYR